MEKLVTHNSGSLLGTAVSLSDRGGKIRRILSKTEIYAPVIRIYLVPVLPPLKINPWDGGLV